MLLFAGLALLAWAESPSPSGGGLDVVFAQTLSHLDEAEHDRLMTHVEAEGAALHQALSEYTSVPKAQVHTVLRQRIAKRLQDRHRAGLRTTADEARRAVVSFEAWQAESFAGAGVFPKRYFGFVDGRGDSAALELRVYRAIRASTDACNRWLAEHEVPWRITDQELVVTWIAEGGALLLTTQQANADRVHPILGIGLDDIAHGFKELPGLVEEVDAAAGTDVANIPTWKDGRWSLRRHMNLEETVVGTAIMWVWEKRIADRKLRETGRPPMEQHDAPTQFVMASLVYNSGILHNGARPGQVQKFKLAGHLSKLATKYNGSRPHLPVVESGLSVDYWLAMGEYPEQTTSWIALYHILQRYGGYEGLSRFSDTFDEGGKFRPEPWVAAADAAAQASQVAPPAAEPPPPLTEQSLGGCGCGAAGGSGGAAGLFLGLVLAWGRRRRVE